MPTNRRLASLTGPDYFPTPTWATQALLDHVTFDGPILEPCCGEGDMAEVIKAADYEVIASDLHPWGYGSVRNLFDVRERHANLVTNPPYNIAEEILSHAFRITDGKICLLLRLSFLESEGRYRKIYTIEPPTTVWVFAQRLSMYHADYEGENGGTTCFAWFVWDMRAGGAPTILRWLAPIKDKRVIHTPTGPSYADVNHHRNRLFRRPSMTYADPMHTIVDTVIVALRANRSKVIAILQHDPGDPSSRRADLELVLADVRSEVERDYKIRRVE
jgi:hypothetical protein